MIRPTVTLDDDLELQRALRKGRIRRGIVTVLGPNRQLTVEQLAEQLYADRDLIVCAINGDGRKFREAYGLARLGIVQWTWTTNGWYVALTPRGKELATRLANGWRP